MSKELVCNCGDCMEVLLLIMNFKLPRYPHYTSDLVPEDVEIYKSMMDCDHGRIDVKDWASPKGYPVICPDCVFVWYNDERRNDV